MKVKVFSRAPEKIIPTLIEMGFEISDNDPDFIVTFGGDGTIVHAEYEYPGIPKIILKDSKICKKCKDGNITYTNEEILLFVINGKYKIENLFKIEAIVNGKTMTALNDITIHNNDPRKAIRYDVSLDSESYLDNIIGDGVVVATPFGSTGYYRSITDSYFEVGFGLAFNNSTEQADHVVLSENREITLVITRGPACLYADNQPESMSLQTGDIVLIRKSKLVAKVVKVDK